MSNPQQPELARSRKTPSQDQDAVAAVVDGQSTPSTEGRTGPVPAENQPGHRPEKEQDKPDLDDFAAKLGVTDQPADEVVDRQIERQAQPLPPVQPARGPQTARKPALAGVLVAVLALGLLLGKRRRRKARRR
ncbi:MAG: LPXTG cell wall anchor domain-containing protein [Acidimicrobiia bacterium]